MLKRRCIQFQQSFFPGPAIRQTVTLGLQYLQTLASFLLLSLSPHCLDSRRLRRHGSRLSVLSIPLGRLRRHGSRLGVLSILVGRLRRHGSRLGVLSILVGRLRRHGSRLGVLSIRLGRLRRHRNVSGNNSGLLCCGRLSPLKSSLLRFARKAACSSLRCPDVTSWPLALMLSCTGKFHSRAAPAGIRGCRSCPGMYVYYI